ncbi:MAG: flippase-like domain-containing protein [Planctomycetes bacterium]|nr:flippase-like domain-containing protein [Planctomycetota bacterium]
MSKHVVTLVKLLVVAGLMWIVFRTIPFADTLLRKADHAAKEQREQVEILGSWQADPLRYRGQDGVDREIHLGPQADGTVIAVDPAIQTYWRGLDGWLFALGAACYFVTALIAGARWWWLLRATGTDVSLWETLRFTWIGIFFNTAMPGSTGGDVVKAVYIMKRCPGHRVQVMVSVIVDRVLGLGSLALLGAIVVLFALDRFTSIAIAIWSVILGVGLLGTFAFSKRLRALIRLNTLLQKLPPKLGHVLRLVDQAVFAYRSHKWVIVGSLVTGVANHVVSVLGVYLLGEAMGVGLPPLEYFALIPIVNIVSAVPLMPNGWGIGEWLYGGLFATYGATYLGGGAVAEAAMSTRGVALSLLYRIHLTCWSFLGGVFVLLEKDRVTQADLQREQALEEQEDAAAAREGADAGMEPPDARG